VLSVRCPPVVQEVILQTAPRVSAWVIAESETLHACLCLGYIDLRAWLAREIEDGNLPPAQRLVSVSVDGIAKALVPSRVELTIRISASPVGAVAEVLGKCSSIRPSCGNTRYCRTVDRSNLRRKPKPMTRQMPRLVLFSLCFNSREGGFP
jgi:hypothetical protein